jgi:PPM family protein phosphatase
MRETFSIAAPPVLVATGTHVGRVRDTNEDRVYADAERGSFAVIDGVGGQAAGELAAEAALDTIRQRLQLQIGTPAERVREAIALANQEIHQQAETHPDRRGMACVLTLVVLQHGTLTAGHVGDTRLYKMRGGSLRKLTHDHSPIGEREDRGEISETEAMRHPRRNEIYREVGAEPRGPDDEGFIELIEEPFESDAALLLCSDGLTDSLSSAAIAEIIQQHAGDPDAVVHHLIDRANESGGKDNVSVVYVEGRAFAPAVRRRTTTSTGPTRVNGTQVVAAARPHEGPARAGEAGHGDVIEGRGASGRGAESSSGAAASARTGGASSTRGADAARSSDPRRTAGAAFGEAAESARAYESGRPSGKASALGSLFTRGSERAGSTVDRRERTGAGRVLAFIGGLLAGVAIALGVAYYMRDMLIPRVEPTAIGPRVLTVGASGGAPYRTIGQAMAVARPGDTIQVGPGDYHEQVVVTDGVHVIATHARDAILRAPQQALQPWTALIITGDQRGSRVSGLRIAGDTQAPVAIGVHVLGRTVLDDVEVSGTTIAGIELAGGVMTVTGASVHDNAGPGFVLKGGEARVAHNLLVRNGTAMPPGVDVVLSEAPRATFTGNVFGGDPAQRVRGLATDQIARFKDANIVLPPPPPSAPAARPRTGTPRRAGPPSSNR